MSEQKFYETKQFMKLKSKWDKKLAKAGFRDIEYLMNGVPGDYLVGPNPEYFLRQGTDRIEAGWEYYSRAREWYWYLLEEGKTSKSDLHIWWLHANGLSATQIQDPSKAAPNLRALVPSRERLSITVPRIRRVLRREKAALQRAVREAQPPFAPGA